MVVMVRSVDKRNVLECIRVLYWLCGCFYVSYEQQVMYVVGFVDICAVVKGRCNDIMMHAWYELSLLLSHIN